MLAWIIDDGPLDWLSRTVSPSDVACWPTGQFFVAEATATQANKGAAQGSPEAKKRQGLLKPRTSAIQAFSIMMDSEASEILYSHLSQPTGTNTNLAENEAIAWALVKRNDAIFVTVDKRAALLALAELGCGRVAHAFDLWLHLREQDLISPDQLVQLCEDTKKSDQSLNNLPLRCQATAASPIT